MDTFAVTLMVRLPVSSADLMERLEPFARVVLAELGGELEEATAELVDSDDHEEDEPEVALTEAEAEREARVLARNEFIVRARETDYPGRGRLPTPAEVAEMVRQYDREHPL